ncbi:MAG: class II fructose-bisphosphate aldolase [Treponema sp.]|jgi:ketose-bisphosphate aldolase|nr:class II fructose-bisphosphate aldolase [Treponema sp.]
MKLQSFTGMLAQARQKHFTVGAFNVLDMETMQAVVRAADRAASPVIVQVYHEDLRFGGAIYYRALAEAAASEVSVPVCLSLDHGQKYEQALECIEAGFTGVMIDLSTSDFNENVENTKRVVKEAHARGVSVEAELGQIVGADSPKEKIAAGFTDPKAAGEFVKLTGIDALAVAIGTAHGMYAEKPRINFELLGELINTIDIPIVVHGGSDTPDNDVKEMVRMGTAKMNIGTDLMNAFNAGILECLGKGDISVPVRTVMTNARRRVEEVAAYKLGLLNHCRE